MKKINKYFLLIITVMFFTVNVEAASYNTPVKSDMTYSECINFQDKVMSTSGNGYFGHCVKASCYSGVWQTQYYISEDMVKCTNGNSAKYNQVINNGCTPYIGRCTPTTTVKYCSTVSFFDCSKTSEGEIYTPPTVAPPTTTRPPLTNRPTTTKPITQTTPPVKQSDNNFLSNLVVQPGEIKFNKFTETYTLGITDDVVSIEVTPTLEDEKAKFIVENNIEINVETPILITVTAENGDIKVYTINLKIIEEQEVLDSNSKISKLSISGYNINFSPDKTTYSITINKDISKLEIDIDLESETSTYEITGNANLKNKSKINIVVTAEDGTKTPYLINIKKSNNIGGIVVVILVVGIAGFVGFKLFVKLTSKEKDSNYEYE